jgi:hypothetical protein
MNSRRAPGLHKLREKQACAGSPQPPKIGQSFHLLGGAAVLAQSIAEAKLIEPLVHLDQRAGDRRGLREQVHDHQQPRNAAARWQRRSNLRWNRRQRVVVCWPRHMSPSKIRRKPPPRNSVLGLLEERRKLLLLLPGSRSSRSSNSGSTSRANND